MASVRRLRRDLGAFAATLGHGLADWQVHDLRLDREFTLLLWGRQLGKSRALALLALWWAFHKPEQTVLVISGSGELGARRLGSEATAFAHGWPALRSSVEDSQAHVLRLTNGSSIRSVAASEGSVRGWRADLLLIDESQLVPDDLLLGAALPTVSAREGARVVLAGTASVASGAFFDLCRRAEVGGDPGLHFSRRVSCLVGGGDAAPWQNPTMLEASIRAMGPARADAEHRCVWSSGADAFIGRAGLDRITADYVAPALEHLQGPARVSVGVDWGWRRDRSAMVCVARLPIPERRLFAVCSVKRWERAHPLPAVVADVVGSPAHFEAIHAETNGLGGPWSQELRSRMQRRAGFAGGAPPLPPWRVVEEGIFDRPMFVVDEEPPGPRRAASFTTTVLGVHIDAKLKAGGYASLRSLFEREALLLPASATELRAELLALRVTLTESGERIEGASDDLADALMLALRPLKFRDGSYGSSVGVLADERTRLPGAELPPRVSGRGPVVETGAGLRLPREPAFQSVVGSEVTFPGAPGPTAENFETRGAIYMRATQP